MWFVFVSHLIAYWNNEDPRERFLPSRSGCDGFSSAKCTFCFPGSSESLLTGRRLLDKAISTSAELHAFASTCKNPPECHDAFTNTEPAHSPVLVDKAVSVSSPTCKYISNLQICVIPFGNEAFILIQHVYMSSTKSRKPEGLHWAREDPREARKRSGKSPNILAWSIRVEPFSLLLPSQVSNGRQFLSVMDLEGKGLHEDLPLHLSPGGTEFTPNYKSSPTSAQLHLLATSIIRSSAATSEPQPNVPVGADLQQRTTHTGICSEVHYCLSDVYKVREAVLKWDHFLVLHTVVADESPSLSHIETNGHVEKVAAEEVKSELCRAINSQMFVPPRASSNPSTAWFSSHLTEMDAQLAAVQRIADSLEKDFSNTKMVTNNDVSKMYIFDTT